MISERSLLLYKFTKRVIKLTVIIIVRYHFSQRHRKSYQISSSHGYVRTYMKLLEIISVGFEITDQLLIRFSAFVRYWRKNENKMRQYIS
jgi:hypothetical protein